MKLFRLQQKFLLLKLLAKNDAIDLPENYKVWKGDISSNFKMEGPDGEVANHFAMKLGKQLAIRP